MGALKALRRRKVELAVDQSGIDPVGPALDCAWRDGEEIRRDDRRDIAAREPYREYIRQLVFRLYSALE
jgi:hypothetical protein